jgi:two-component system, chemotaxis family, protein-glutamate methylesterase/glutaminase
MEKRNIIVIGASAGGFQAIQDLVRHFPANMDASIFITWHIAPDIRGILPDVLNRNSHLHAKNAVDGEAIELNRIYVAPPDHHMLLEKGVVRVRKGPKENRFRPAIDPLFRSAAYVYGPRVTGIILSGALDDGTAGLWTIKEYGGMAIVQDPLEAEVPSMPQSAIQSVQVDHILPIEEMPRVLINLVNESVPDMPAASKKNWQKPFLKQEIDIAMNHKTAPGYTFGELTPYTCPECHGVLAALNEGNRVRFRCHTGHAFSTDALIAAITSTIEENLWSAIRNVRECVMLLNLLGDHHASLNQPKLAALYFKKAGDAEQRENILRSAVTGHEKLSTEGISQQAEERI